MHVGPLSEVPVSPPNLKDISALRGGRELTSWTQRATFAAPPGPQLSSWVPQSYHGSPFKSPSESVPALLSSQSHVLRSSPISPDILGAFPYLQLPGELRNLIYSLFIPQNQTLRLPFYLHAPQRSPTRRNSLDMLHNAYCWKPIHPSILRISSQIRHEVLAHFYERNTFEVHATSLARFLDPIHALDRLSLRSLILKGGFYMLDCPEDDDLVMAKLLQSLNLTRLHLSAVVSLWLIGEKGNLNLRTLDVDEFIMRSGMCHLMEVRGLQKCTVTLEPSHMTRRSPDLGPWLRRLERRLEAVMTSPLIPAPPDSSSAMELC